MLATIPVTCIANCQFNYTEVDPLHKHMACLGLTANQIALIHYGMCSLLLLTGIITEGK